MTTHLIVDIPSQTLTLLQDNQVIQHYLVSTARNGPGELINSEKTPRGWHIIRAKVGEGYPPNAVFVERRPTWEVYSTALKRRYPDRDWVLIRILWLSGLEVGKNRLREVDTMRRYFYIHGSGDEIMVGKPGSRGCIRMHNHDIIELFDQVSAGDRVYIEGCEGTGNDFTSFQ